MSSFKDYVTGVNGAIGVITSLIALTVFIYAAHANSNEALENDDKQDVQISSLRQGQNNIRTDVALTKQSVERTEKDVAEIKSDIADMRRLLTERYNKN